MGTDFKSVPIFHEREGDLKRRTAAEEDESSAAVLFHGWDWIIWRAGNTETTVISFLQFDFVVPLCYHYIKSFQIEDLAMQTIDVNQAKQHFPELIEQTISGDEVVITQEGQPVVRLVAMIKPPRKQRRFGSARGLIKMADDIGEPLEDFKEYT